MKRKKEGAVLLALLLSICITFTTFAADIPMDAAVAVTEEGGESEESKESGDSVESVLPEENSAQEEQGSEISSEENVDLQGAQYVAPAAVEAAANDEWTAADFTYGEASQTLTGCDYKREIIVKGQVIKGLSESGQEKIAINKNLVIPSQTPDGTTIVGIGQSAFIGMGIETVVFPENMMIPYDDQLTGVIHERGNFIIQSSAFANNNISNIEFPEGILYIDALAFKNNKLSSVTFPHTLWMVGNSSFANNQLTKVNFCLNPDFMFQMDSLAFAYNQIKSVTLPYNCEKVYMYTFMGNPGMESLSPDAPEKFQGTGGVVYMYTQNPEHFNMDRIHHIERTAANQKSWFQKLVLGDEPIIDLSWKSEDFTYEGTCITGLSDSGITKRTDNKNLVLPDKNPEGEYITEIAAGNSETQGTFSTEDEVFQSVKLPSKLEIIGDYAFKNCPVTSLDLPVTVKTIGKEAFAGNQLPELAISGNLKVIDSGVFAQAGTEGTLKSLELQEGITKIGAEAFANSGLTTVALPMSLMALDKDAFKGSTAGVVELSTDNYRHIEDKENFAESEYHTIKLNTANWKSEDFTYNEEGTILTGLSDSGILKRKENKKLILPDKGPGGLDITGIASGDSNVSYGIFGAEGEVFESVELPEKLETIGDRAFLNNKLTSVIFPETVTSIGLQAFALNDLSEVVLPDSVTSLGGAAFSNNIHLTKVQLSANLKVIPATAFGITLANTLNVGLVQLTIPEGVESIGSGAFGGHEIHTLALPVSLKKIDSRAFKSNQIQNLYIPDNVTELGSSAFEQTSGKNCLASVRLPEGLLKINSKTFANAALTRVDIPYSLATLNKNAFYGNKDGFVQVYTPNDEHISFEVSGATFQIHIRTDVWTIKDFAYDGAKITGLSETGIKKREENRNLVLPDKTPTGDYITEIGAGKPGEYGLFGAENLGFDSVKLPSRVEKIGNFAFQNNGLKEVSFPDTLSEIGVAAFQINQLVNIVLPDSVTTLGGGAFGTNPTLQSLVLSENIKDIPAGAFGCSTKTEYMTGFTSVEIPEGVETIGDNAFAGNNFTEIVIPSTVKSIGKYAFSTKNTLNEVTTLILPEGLTTIGNRAFRNQNILTVDLPYSVTALPKEVFEKEFKDGTSGVTTVRVENYQQYTDKTLFKDSDYHVYEINADTYKATDFVYDSENPVIITGLSDNGVMKRPLNRNLVIPAQNTTGETVIEIANGVAGGYGVFGTEGEGFDSVSFPESLKKIGNFAFRDNGLKNVNFTNGLENIGMQAFGQNYIEEVILPDSVNTMGSGAFATNPELKKVVLSKGMTEIPASAFTNNTPAKNFTVLEIPEGIKTIDNYAFSGNSLSEVRIPSTVTKIGSRAFAQTADNATITNVNLPSGLMEIGSRAFTETLITRVDIPNRLEKLAKDVFRNAAGRVVSIHTSNKDHLTNAKGFYATSDWHKVVYNQLVESGWSEDDFTYDGSVITGWSEKGNQTRLENHNLVLPSTNPETGEDISMIGEAAFQIPDDEWEQGKNGIYSPNGMESVLLPERLIEIGNKAFQYNSLVTVEFPASVTTIGESAFNSNKLEKLILPDTITEVKDGAFSTNVLTEITLSDGMTRIAQAVFSMNINLTHIEIPDTITEIDDFAFAGARLETLDIPESVERIGRKAFHLHHLTELTIPGNVKEIGESAFEGTFKALTLKKLVLEEGIEKIGLKAFKEGYLESVELPSTLMSLADDTFMNNTGTDNSYVVECYTSNPAHLKFQSSKYHKIIYRALVWDVDDFTYGDGVNESDSVITGLSEKGLKKLENCTDLVLPQKNAEGKVITGIGAYAFADLPFKLTSVVFADGLCDIGEGAFKDNALQEMTLPSSLKSIGAYAFAGNRITEIVLPEKVESMDKTAFDSNKGADGNKVVVKVYITNPGQEKLPESDGYEIIFTKEVPEQKPAESQQDESKSTAVKTGDPANTVPLLVGMCIAMSAIALLLKRRTSLRH